MKLVKCLVKNWQIKLKKRIAYEATVFHGSDRIQSTQFKQFQTVKFDRSTSSDSGQGRVARMSRDAILKLNQASRSEHYVEQS